MYETALRNRAIKKFVTKDLGLKARVIGGTGTAYGWVTVGIETEKPSDCTCTPGSEYCQECKQVMHKGIEVEAKIVEKFGTQMSSYCDDMGGDNLEILVTTNFL